MPPILMTIVVVGFSGFSLLLGIYRLASGDTHPAVALTCLLVGFVITGIGVTVGYHRLATHKSFETHPVVKAALFIAGSMAWAGPLKEWAEDHLVHHANSDIPGKDPHTPRDGLFWSHIGWLQYANQREISLAKPLLRDPVIVWVSNWFPVWAVLSLAIPAVVGLLTASFVDVVLWGGYIRIAAVHQAMWSVNSAGHRWGYQSFVTHDYSTNNWVVGLLALGEGWHNNHHAFPQSPFHGLRWWEFDLSGYVIRGLRLLRLARNVHAPSKGDIARKHITRSFAKA